MSKKWDSLHRIDLSEENKLELEEIKSSITDSLESVFSTIEIFSPTSVAMSSLPSFDALISIVSHSAPVSTSRVGVRVHSLVQDFKNSSDCSRSTSEISTKVSVCVSKIIQSL